MRPLCEGKVSNRELYKKFKDAIRRPTCKMDADPGVKLALDQKLKEQEEVRNQISDLNKAINAVRVMSLPVELTAAQFNAEIVPTKTGLKTRSKMLLIPPVEFQNVGYINTGAPASDKKSRSAWDEI